MAFIKVKEVSQNVVPVLNIPNVATLKKRNSYKSFVTLKCQWHCFCFHLCFIFWC